MVTKFLLIGFMMFSNGDFGANVLQPIHPAFDDKASCEAVLTEYREKYEDVKYTRSKGFKLSCTPVTFKN